MTWSLKLRRRVSVKLEKIKLRAYMGSFLKNNNFEYFFHHFLYLYNYFKNNKIGNRIQAIQLYLIFSLSIN